MEKVVDKVRELTSSLLQEKEIELVDIVYRRESEGMVLRLLIDKEDGVTLDDCLALNELIGNILDEENAIYDKYVLEISSPGLDRPLKTRRDFEKVLGKKICVHTFVPINNKKDYEGVLSSVDDENITVDDSEIPLDKISKAKLRIEI